MRNIETFPSKQMYPDLSLDESKVAEFYHNIDRKRWLVWLKWLIFITFSRQLMVSLYQGEYLSREIYLATSRLFKMGSRLFQLELLLPHEFAFSAPFCQTALTPSKSRKQFIEPEIPWHSVKVVRIWCLSLPINWCSEKARCQFKYKPIEV